MLCAPALSLLSLAQKLLHPLQLFDTVLNGNFVVDQNDYRIGIGSTFSIDYLLTDLDGGTGSLDTYAITKIAGWNYQILYELPT